MKNLLFISNLFPNPSEFSRAAYNLQTVLALKRHYNVYVVAPISWIQRLEYDFPVPCFRFENGMEVHHPTYWYFPKYFRSAQGVAFGLSIDRLVSSLIESKQIDIVYSSWLFPDGYSSLRIASKYKLPCYIHVAGTDVNRLMPNSRLTRIAIETIDSSAGVISVSNALSEKIKSLGCNNDNIFTVYNGVDSSIFKLMDKEKLRCELGVCADDKVILFVGNIILSKGVFELFEAFLELYRKDKGWKLVYVGDGDCKDKLSCLVEKSSLQKSVKLLGRLPLKEISKWMNVSSLLCLPSHSEGLPNVIIEARACGLPVVATGVGGIPELSKTLGAITLVPVNDISMLSAAIHDVFSNQAGFTEPCLLGSWESKADNLFRIFERNC